MLWTPTTSECHVEIIFFNQHKFIDLQFNGVSMHWYSVFLHLCVIICNCVNGWPFNKICWAFSLLTLSHFGSVSFNRFRRFACVWKIVCCTFFGLIAPTWPYNVFSVSTLIGCVFFLLSIGYVYFVLSKLRHVIQSYNILQLIYTCEVVRFTFHAVYVAIVVVAAIQIFLETK